MSEFENEISSFEELQRLDNNAPYYFAGSKGASGWKIHIFLNKEKDKYPSRDTPVMRNLCKYLIDSGYEHKFKNRVDGAKTFAVYIGTRDDTIKFAQNMDKIFGADFSKMSPNGSKVVDEPCDWMITPNIGMRFDAVNKYKARNGAGYGYNGVPRFVGIHKLQLQHFAKSWFGKDVSDEQEMSLQLLASHMMLAKHCGSKYLGSDYKNDNNDWDKFIFDDIQGFSVDEIKKYSGIFDGMYAHLIKDNWKSKDENSVNINLSAKFGTGQPDTQGIINKFDKKEPHFDAMTKSVMDKWDRR
ncbi:MAG: hypothetical protein LBL47_03220 [Lactobacillus sp.]|jgi:hypothetical protein|nr:hypothetical protein [Lactobacillus sp.]